MILVKGDLVCQQTSDPQPWTEVGPHHIFRPDTSLLQFWAGAWLFLDLYLSYAGELNADIDIVFSRIVLYLDIHVTF